jgi:ADP-dependent NAD(P)H-hydrate dehydratase / NAD(P)H-hydrate epimerase
MRPAFDVAQIRAAEEPLIAALPPGTLMQRAATALARRCADLLGGTYGARVVLLVGSGNNGGDALFAGVRLLRRGARVDALLVGGSAHDDGLAAFRAAGGRVHEARPACDRLLADAALVIDGMLGIGGRGGLRDEAARLAALAGEGGAVVVAVDVPSGIDASTGAVDGPAVRADVTVTFGGLKTGLVVAPGALHAGMVEVVDIGLSLPPAELALPDADDVAAVVPAPAAETDKYRRGVVGVVAGSDRYTGAAVLAVGGALAAGAGMVRYAGASKPSGLVRRRWPETVVTEVAPGDAEAVLASGQVQSWVVGSGLGTDDAAAAVVRALLDTDLPVVVDADAVTIVAADPAIVRGRSAPTVLTPHAGEFARLRGLDRGDVEAHRLGHVRAAATDLGVVVLLKGATTLVAQPDGHVFVNPADTPYLATAGSGDVLSGVCGTLLAGGAAAGPAAVAAAFLHGLAGLEAAGHPAVPITAMDLVARLPSALRAVRG